MQMQHIEYEVDRTYNIQSIIEEAPREEEETKEFAPIQKDSLETKDNVQKDSLEDN